MITKEELNIIFENRGGNILEILRQSTLSEYIRDMENYNYIPDKLERLKTYAAPLIALISKGGDMTVSQKLHTIAFIYCVNSCVESIGGDSVNSISGERQ